jgi:hypothetical protein
MVARQKRRELDKGLIARVRARRRQPAAIVEPDDPILAAVVAIVRALPAGKRAAILQQCQGSGKAASPIVRGRHGPSTPGRKKT